MDLQEIEQEALTELERVSSLGDLESLYTRVLGRKEGHLTKILRNLGALPPEEKKQVGQAANQLRTLLEEKFSTKQKTLQHSSIREKLTENQIDPTLPGIAFNRVHSHPIVQTIQAISK